MITILIAVVAAVAAGAYLRWAVKPTLTAFGLGKSLGYLEASKRQQ